jgi:hypothetical protein
MGRPSLGERKRIPLRLPPAVEEKLVDRAGAADLDCNSLMVLLLCDTFGVDVPPEYEKKKGRLAAALSVGQLATPAAA